MLLFAFAIFLRWPHGSTARLLMTLQCPNCEKQKCNIIGCCDFSIQKIVRHLIISLIVHGRIYTCVYRLPSVCFQGGSKRQPRRLPGSARTRYWYRGCEDHGVAREKRSPSHPKCPIPESPEPRPTPATMPRHDWWPPWRSGARGAGGGPEKGGRENGGRESIWRFPALPWLALASFLQPSILANLLVFSRRMTPLGHDMSASLNHLCLRVLHTQP